MRRISLGLETRYLFIELFGAFFEGLVAAAEAVSLNLAVDVEFVDFVHGLGDSLLLFGQNVQNFFFVVERLVGFVQVFGDFIRGEEEVLELLMEDRFQIDYRNLVRQAWQTYFGVLEGTYILLPQMQWATPAKRWTGFLEMTWGASLAGVNQSIAAIPQFLRYQWFDGRMDPFLFGLEFLLSVHVTGVVGSVDGDWHILRMQCDYGILCDHRIAETEFSFHAFSPDVR